MLTDFFAVASGCPGSASLAGLAGESRELWKWLQYCPLSCQVGWDRQVGFVFMINLPGVIAGGMLFKRVYQWGGGGGGSCIITLLSSSVCCFGEQCANVQRLLSFVRCVYTAFIHALPMCVHAK